MWDSASQNVLLETRKRNFIFSARGHFCPDVYLHFNNFYSSSRILFGLVFDFIPYTSNVADNRRWT